MGLRRLLQGILIGACVFGGCHAIRNTREFNLVAASETGSRRSAGQPRTFWGTIGRDARTASSANPSRPTATAVAPTTSHLSAGRSASGVLENCVEACLKTVGAYVSGSITGFIFGGISGGTFNRVADAALLKSMRTTACRMGGDWGELTAAFTGFSSVSRIVRGRNDKWDQVVGACAAGAYLNRAKGPAGMIQGASTYGMFSLVFSAMDKKDESDVVDVPVDPLEKKR